MKNIAGVLIEKNGEYLLVQERKPDVYGLWNIPAGHVDEGESIEQAAKREGEEETGYTLKLGVKVGSFPLTEGNGSMHIFKAEISKGEIRFDQEELLDVKWFKPEEIKKLNLREIFIKKLVGIE